MPHTDPTWNCKRCSEWFAQPKLETRRAPCGCDNFYCRPCREAMDFQRWLAKYALLHSRVGGRYVDGRPRPCPTRQDDPIFREYYEWLRREHQEFLLRTTKGRSA